MRGTAATGGGEPDGRVPAAGSRRLHGALDDDPARRERRRSHRLLDGEVAGNVVAFDYEGRREVGYWIGRTFWSKGVATGALRAFLDEVTERPLYAGVAETNVASKRVLEKCGFTISEAPAGDDDGHVLMRLG
jgi:RimJ/RimL family protein N-acetyltransferase